MTPAFLAEFVVRAVKEPIGRDMRRVLAQTMRAMSPGAFEEFCREWYARDPDSLERAIRGMPEREEFHNRLINSYRRTPPT